MTSTAAAGYKDYIEGKLIVGISTGTTTGVTVKIKQVNGATPTWPTVAHRIKIVQRTATMNKVEKIEVAAGTTQSGQTVTLGTLTRALSLYDGTTFTGSVGTAQSFAAGADVFITWDAHDAAQSAKLDLAQTFSALNTFTGGIYASGSSSYVRVPNMTTAQRTGLSASNGMIVYDTDLSQFYKYEGGAWAAIATGTFSNAADHTAGKVDIASATEIGAGTATDGTSGAVNVIPVSQTAKTSSGSGDENKLPVLNSSGQIATGFLPNIPVSKLNSGTNASASTFWNGAGAWAALLDTAKCVYSSGTASSGAGASSTSVVAFDTHSYTIPANDLVNGVIYVAIMQGVSNMASGTLKIGLALGGTNAAQSSAVTTTNENWWQIAVITGTTTAGASAAVRGFITGYINSTVTNGVTNSTNFATNGTLALQPTAQMGTNNAGNTTVCNSFTVFRLCSTAS